MWATPTFWTRRTSFGRGGALPQLFETIAQRHGKRGFQVRKGMANVAKYLRTTAMGQAWRREQGRLLSHWDVIFLLWGAVGKGSSSRFPPSCQKAAQTGLPFLYATGKGRACAGRRPYMLCWRMSTISWWVSTL